MKKNMTCIVCPIGCQMTVSYDEADGKATNIEVSGNTCPRGVKYAKTELTDPQRTLTTTIRTVGGSASLLPVKSSKPIPKDKLFEGMDIVNSNVAYLPVKVGDTIIANFVCEGVDLVACCDMK